MCGYIVKVCGSENKGVRDRQCQLVIIWALTPFRAWHVTSIIGVGGLPRNQKYIAFLPLLL
jgi:hypothetical protein